MRVPVSWLRELVDIDVDVEELAERLSMTGSAVDKIDRFAPGVSGVVVGEVLDVSDVPDSEKLVVAQVDTGSHGKVQVVAGAKNFAKGERVPVALPGARVTTLDSVGVRPMAGYESHGMLCSAYELGISDDHGGILVLGPDVELGADVAALLGLDDDVLEFEIYPNRPDQMSVLGIARETALLYGKTLRPPDATVVEEGPPVTDLTSVTIDDRKGCPRYLARVIDNVSFGPAPAVVQARLSACGFRPLGNLVDATNYALLLVGQPLHAFDLDRLDEQRIVVRRARAAEELTTIDGEPHKLDATDLVIADASVAQAIAGVMGGAASEVGEGTVRVLLESAYFDPVSVSRTARRHRIRTEASARFERGADPERVPDTAAMAAEMMRRWAGGRVAKTAVDAGAAPERRTLTLRPERIEVILGIAPGTDECVRVLSGLGCDVRTTTAALEVVAPSWRPDLEREVDLIEEIARIHGYENVPSVLRPGLRGGRSSAQKIRERVREVLLGAGLYEATLSSFAPRVDLDAAGYEGPVVKVANPMTVEQEQLRPSLLPGLLRSAQRNVAHGVTNVRLFEFGKVFTAWPDGAELPNEAEHVGVVLVGRADDPSWYADDRAVDVFDLKGTFELVLSELGIEGPELRRVADMPFHPGRAAEIVLGGEIVGRFGEVRPTVARAFDIESNVVVGHLEVEPLMQLARRKLTVAALPTQPPVLRDIAMALAEDVAAKDVIATILEAGGETLESVVLVDVYRGAQVGEGRRSLAFRLTFRALDRTLTADEVDQGREAIVRGVAERHGAEVR